MKYFLTVFALSVLSTVPYQTLSAQDTPASTPVVIAVVDMQEALNEYHKTKTEVKQLNAMIERRQQQVEVFAEEFKKEAEKAKELNSKYQDSSLSEELRKKAFEDLKEMAPELTKKEKELALRRQKAAAELSTARSEMETRLVKEIKAVLDSVIGSKGVDLVFDKSFLPKANKSILFTSDKVLDLTGDLIATLNAGAPQ